jgi:SAM-dependent methyltransferase
VSRTPQSYFDRLCAADEDPWEFETSWYERRKYAVTLASLPDERYGHAYEPGCSIGVFTEMLAPRCDRLSAADLSVRASTVAARRLSGLSHVEVRQATIPEEWPTGPFDLLVLGEIGYYFDRPELQQLIDRARRSLQPGATVVAVHWTGTTNYPLSAAETHAVLGATPDWTPVAHHDDEQFLLDVWHHEPAQPAGSTSIARSASI